MEENKNTFSTRPNKLYQDENKEKPIDMKQIINEKFTKTTNSENKKIALIPIILMLISYLLLIGIFSAIANQHPTKKKNFEYVFYLSKILTVKSIVRNKFIKTI